MNQYDSKAHEQNVEFHGRANYLELDALEVISRLFHVDVDEIVDIMVLKKGMTNRSFLFSVHGEKYIIRIPGEGTDYLINRTQEAEVYRTIKGLGLCDDPLYINAQNGYKITKFLEGIRVCDANSMVDLERCMEKLRQFHSMKIKVGHTFDLFGQIEFYEDLWSGRPSMFPDYNQTKSNIFSLKRRIDGMEKEWCLTHIDAVPDNFLFYMPKSDECGDEPQYEKLQLTDWEYAGMQDPHVDIAMFCIYSLYNKEQVDRLIDIYFENQCDRTTRIKIYAYISICGLLWSNWCEFKRTLGVEFGEYAFDQYQFAKDYCGYVMDEWD